MNDNNNITSAVDKILEFAEFYVTLGDLYGQDLLVAIGEKDPAFTYYMETVTESFETAIDFLKVYGEWGIAQVRNQCGTNWNEVKNACLTSPKYQNLGKKWKGSTVLWDLLEEILGK
ncbi:MAG: hypothetical protein PHY28_00795 [Dehalococcoidales bacterium]|nr:hypothetical protein [Dehalococcoidales bacterium]